MQVSNLLNRKRWFDHKEVEYLEDVRVYEENHSFSWEPSPMDPAEIVVSCIIDLINPEAWTDYGGDEARAMILNDMLICEAPPEMLLDTAQLLDQLGRAIGGDFSHERSRRQQWFTSDSPGTESRVSLYDLRDLCDQETVDSQALSFEDTVEELMTSISPDSWTDHGGEEATLIQIVHEFIVIQAPIEIHRGVATFLEARRQEQSEHTNHPTPSRNPQPPRQSPAQGR